jgi:LETM1 and EF-hand domain-containing protein 1, mitochondrial
VIETIGKENVQLSDKQLNEILDLLDKEEMIETEEKIEKALKKEKEVREAAKIKEIDMTEDEKKFLLEDKAQELNENGSEIDPKIEQVVKTQSEKILKQIPPATPSTTTKTNGSPQPKDKLI